MRIDRLPTTVDLPLLVALEQLLESGSVTAAARRLGTTQPSMSRMLARLRAAFEDPLLVSVGRRMEPSARARELRPRLEAALRAMRELFEPEGAFAPERERRTLRVAASDYATVVVLKPWIRRLRVEAPGVVVRVEPAGPESVDRLAGGEIDLAIAPRAPIEGMEQFVFRKVLDDRLVCVLRTGHRRRRRSLSLADYLALEHIVVSNARSNVSAVQLALHRLRKTRRVVLAVPSFLAALAAVAESELAAALPEKLVRREGRGVEMHRLPFDVEPMSLHLIWHPRRTTDVAHRWVRDGIVAALNEP
ncbi:MAG: Transcriptional regulator, LysR family protein [Myxococcaceae bacterium]|nr:Transcriptional regulator, LysR family protein [Myxococcaceae bacterium]